MDRAGPSVTSVSSLCLEARGLTFCIYRLLIKMPKGVSGAHLHGCLFSLEKYPYLSSKTKFLKSGW